MTRIRQTLLALPLLLLGGCTAYEWYQPGAVPEQVQADRSDCARSAQSEAFIYGGPFGGPFFHSSPAWYVGPYCNWRCAHRRYHDDLFYYQFQRDAAVSRLTDFCMRSKGYALREVAPSSTP